MDNCVHYLSDSVCYIASDNTWIESKAIQQLEITAQLPDMAYVAGMPDLHPGRGYPIGAAFFSVNRFYPALVGNDIGCGMTLFQTEFKNSKLNLDKAEKQLSEMSDIAPLEWLEAYLPTEMHNHPFAGSLGSIGGGNHFAEFQQIDQVLNETLFAESGINKKQLLLLVHSGSRGLGQSILRAHTEQFGHKGLIANTEDANEYLQAHNNALDYAKINRRLIGERMMRQIRTQGVIISDVNHNLVEPCELYGQQGWLHRKGATPAHHDMVVIPGSRGDHSYIVKPIVSELSLYSLPHGAGRKWMRTECKGRLSHRFTPLQLSRTAFGSRIICANKQLIYEEAPQSYKSIETVIESMVSIGLIEVIARLKPVITYKTSGEMA
ncbi:RNA ligase RtcB family protein [Proteus faecis]|uniref:3'-phosphate/5'-hydroxy nucleic acid ligase n=1 Tax=Proteus faecis TaxID=2050967 RepID=A0AAW7CLX8_9GAMM|nr:RNA ligase RtcB family protein [Proteus faecis]MDL5167241.1 RNA ligase RtcB family protein [Proteus faecis]MDL5275105.1 RNA ligase RtcB family protein [Proteus faecis]MDL5278674.1 RNA ligase RtcB family protein [Proteus faecis]MDL5307676.1 RNA ligase RtcB family protein [Proteus faecis]MDL5311355.1 RNA ligase RtcB family protein [Proteus faecis]